MKFLNKIPFSVYVFLGVIVLAFVMHSNGYDRGYRTARNEFNNIEDDISSSAYDDGYSAGYSDAEYSYEEADPEKLLELLQANAGEYYWSDDQVRHFFAYAYQLGHRSGKTGVPHEYENEFMDTKLNAKELDDVLYFEECCGMRLS